MKHHRTPGSSRTSRASRRTRIAGAILTGLLSATAVGAQSIVTATPASAQAITTLTAQQKRAYLYYYAPVLLKRGDENNGKVGRDWMTNFDFDRDGDFSNNRINWANVPSYAGYNGPDAARATWQIRPTMYTSAIEYMENGSKTLVLLYHVYNASDKDLSEIHDWERIEIIVRNVSGTPGSPAEGVSSSTVTLHKEHHMRRATDPGALNFLRTATGNHLLIWQADESNFDLPGGITGSPHGHELHFVNASGAAVAQQLQYPTGRAEVSISGSINNPQSPKNVHYVFVPEQSSATVALAGAQTLNAANARWLASRVDNGDRVGWNETKRLTYELQDLADIITTQWSQNPRVLNSWLPTEKVDVVLESPITNEAGGVEVPAGRQTFYSRSRDIQKGEDGRDGYITKSWLYGSYSAELNPERPFSNSDNFRGFDGLGSDSLGLTRGAASGRYDSHGQYWWQHDFFVHNGQINSADLREEGTWLRGDWYLPQNGGSDGRWTQLFDDAPSAGNIATLQVTVRTTSGQCSDTGRVAATIIGGQAPYNVQWSGVYSSTGTSATVGLGQPILVTVTDAAGARAVAGHTYIPVCGGNESLQ